MKIGSMFCGIGGIDLAFQQAGHSVVWANDNDKYSCRTYKHNFGEKFLVEKDIRNVDKKTIPDIDILSAGFPCQPFSVCGKKKGFEDERGSLFFEVGKVIDEKHPRVVFLENVANLVEHDDGKSFNVVHNELAGRDYYIRYIVAEACEYGNMPQHRTRTYILAFKEKSDCDKFVFPDKVPLNIGISELIDIHKKADAEFYYEKDSYEYKRLATKEINRNRLYRFADYGIQESETDIAFTLKANMGTYPNRIPIIKDDFGIRRLSPRECLTLQGFPKEFAFPDSVPQREQYKQAGNTVCVPVISKMVNALK